MHCFKNKQFQGLGVDWEGLVRAVLQKVLENPRDRGTLAHITTKPIYIRLDLDKILQQDSGAFADADDGFVTAKGEVDRTLRELHKISPLHDFIWNRDSRHVRDVFITNELADWVLKSLITHIRSDLRRRAAGLISLRTITRSPAEQDAEAPHSDGETGTRTELYLQTIQDLFGDDKKLASKKDSESTAPSTNSFDSLSRRLTFVDTAFSDPLFSAPESTVPGY